MSTRHAATPPCSASCNWISAVHAIRTVLSSRGSMLGTALARPFGGQPCTRTRVGAAPRTCKACAKQALSSANVQAQVRNAQVGTWGLAASVLLGGKPRSHTARRPRNSLGTQSGLLAFLCRRPPARRHPTPVLCRCMLPLFRPAHVAGAVQAHQPALAAPALAAMQQQQTRPAAPARCRQQPAAQPAHGRRGRQLHGWRVRGQCYDVCNSNTTRRARRTVQRR